MRNLAKILLGLILMALMLCQDVNASQTKADTSNKASAPTTVTVKTQNSIDKNPEPHQQNANNADKEIVRKKDFPLVERVKKLANKANLALLFSCLATIIAGLSLFASKRSNRISRDALEATKNTSRAEFQPYLSFSDKIDIRCDKTILTGITTRAIVEKEGNRLNPQGFIEVTNEGKTPALDGRFSCIGIMRNDEWEVPINLRGSIPYLGVDKTVKAKVLEYIRLNRDIEGDRFNIVNMWFDVEVRISFRDPFSENKRRVFRSNYRGGHIRDGVQSGFFRNIRRKSFAEVEPTDTDDIRHWEM